jgi:hypothetical protein
VLKPLFVAAILMASASNALAHPPSSWQRFRLVHDSRTTLLALQECQRIELRVRAIRGRRGTLQVFLNGHDKPWDVPIEIRHNMILDTDQLELGRVRTAYRGRFRILGPCDVSHSDEQGATQTASSPGERR